MRTAEVRKPAVRHERWTPARMFLAVSTLYHLPLGVAGLIYDQTFPVGASAAERAGSALVFGVFETNGWHSVAALAVGLTSVFFAISPHRARDFALAIGLFHVGIVASLEIWDPSTFWLASNFADQVIHGGTALGGIASALLTRPSAAQAASSG